jgi:hypothetical protein
LSLSRPDTEPVITLAIPYQACHYIRSIHPASNHNYLDVFDLDDAHLIFYTGVASGLIVDPLSPSTNATAVLWWKIVPEDAVAPPLIGILGYSHVEPPAIVGIW